MEPRIRKEKKKGFFQTVGVLFCVCGLSLIELVIVFAPVPTIKCDCLCCVKVLCNSGAIVGV